MEAALLTPTRVSIIAFLRRTPSAGLLLTPVVAAQYGAASLAALSVPDTAAAGVESLVLTRDVARRDTAQDIAPQDTAVRLNRDVRVAIAVSDRYGNVRPEAPKVPEK